MKKQIIYLKVIFMSTGDGTEKETGIMNKEFLIRRSVQSQMIWILEKHRV